MSNIEGFPSISLGATDFADVIQEDIGLGTMISP